MQITISILALTTMLAGTAPAKTMTFTGACDGSAAVSLGNHRFLVGEDEHNLLHIYDLEHPDAAPKTTEIWSFLEVEEKDEADIEGAAWLGDRIFWISSHGRDSKGNIEKAREQLFATRVSVTEDGLKVAEIPYSYTGLIAALLADDKLAELDLLAATRPSIPNDPDLKPKSKGFNIEGLSASADRKSLLIGLRNPISAKGAIVIPLLNPNDVIVGAKPKLGAPIFLDLALGEKHLRIRSMEAVRVGDTTVFYIVGGPVDQDGEFALFRWSGVDGEKPTLVQKIDDLRPEAVFADPDDPGKLVLLSDDGEVLFPATEAECKKDKLEQGKCACKDLKESKRRSFRAMIVTP